MLKSQRIVLRSLQASDINSTYLGWLNDPLVSQYLETRFVPQTLDSIQAYWESNRDNPLSPWFAICSRSDNLHIGNIKLGPINWIHRKADLGLFIGNRTFWGQGYATEAIALLRDWAFRELDLQKLNAGVYACNPASRRAFEKSGFEIAGSYWPLSLKSK